MVTGPGEFALGDYRLTTCLGRGAVGEVWAGEDTRRGVEVAVKIILGAAESVRARREFQREIEALAGLQHPSIIQILDFGEVDEAATRGTKLRTGDPFVVTELAHGALSDAVGKPLDWEEIRRILIQLLEGLAHAHARDIVHRDIKPPNILRVGQRWKIADFGLTWQFRKQRTTQPSVAGTLAYMGPEHFLGEWRDFGPPTDLYSVGVLAYELACGRRPFEETSLTGWVDAHVRQQPADLQPTRPVPQGFGDWVSAMLRKSPFARFRYAADALDALRELGAPVAGSAMPLPEMGNTGLSDTLADTVVGAEFGFDDDPTERFHQPATEQRTAPQPATMKPLALSLQTPQVEAPSLQLFSLRGVPCVGRLELRERLWENLTNVSSSGTAVIDVLEGVSGVGKSAVARWLLEHALEQGAATGLHVRYTAEGGRSDGIVTALASYLRVAGLEPSRVHDRVSRYFAARGGAPEWLVAGLGAVLRAAAAGEEGGVPVSDRLELFEALVRYETTQRPMLLVLDDIQWTEEAVAFCQRILGSARPLPVHIVATVQTEALRRLVERSPRVRALAEHPAVNWEVLEPLTLRESRRLLLAMLPLESATLEHIAAKASGNPLFAIHVLDGLVRHESVQWTKNGFFVEPAKLREHTHLSSDQQELASIAELERSLSEQDLAAWEIAAVLGQDVDWAEWYEACSQMGIAATDRLVAELARRRLANTTKTGWRFEHVLVRESLLARLADTPRWQSLHLAIARGLTRLAGGVPKHSHLAGRIGQHYFESGEFGLALEPLRFAHPPWQEYAGEGEHTARTALPFLALHAEACDREGLADDDHERLLGRVLLLHARLSLGTERIDARAELEALDLLIDGSDAELAATFELTLAAFNRRLGNSLARGTRAANAFAIADAAGLDDIATFALARRGDAAYYCGQIDEALDCYQGYLQRSLEGSRDRAFALYSIGYCHFARGQLDEALEHMTRALYLTRKLGARIGEIHVLHGLAETERHRGNFEESLRWCMASRTAALAAGRPIAQHDADILLIHILRRDAKAAREMAAEIDLSRMPADTLARTRHIHLLRAALAIEDGDAKAAAELLLKATNRTGTVERDEPLLCEHLAARASEEGAVDVAVEALNLALQLWEDLQLATDAARVRRDLETLKRNAP